MHLIGQGVRHTVHKGDVGVVPLTLGGEERRREEDMIREERMDKKEEEGGKKG